eukprot:Skav234047  [mRNA]  locus=scaffold619:25656:27300:- [translate_table: standard]
MAKTKKPVVSRRITSKSPPETASGKPKKGSTVAKSKVVKKDNQKKPTPKPTSTTKSAASSVEKKKKKKATPKEPVTTRPSALKKPSAETQEAEKERANKQSLKQQIAQFQAMQQEAESGSEESSTTHKKEWDSFNRAIQSRKNFPVDLASYVAKSKNCMFNAWLDSGRDWDQCRLILKRTHEASDENLSGWVAKSGKDLIKEFGEEKGQKLIQARFNSNLFYNSEDFPDDPLERMYYMKKPRELTRREVVTNQANLEGKENLDRDMVKALLDENEGMFRAGAMPVDRGLAAAGQKALLDGIAEGGVQAVPKKRPAPKNEGSEEAKPKTQQDLAADLMAAILAESTAARKKSMNLGAVNYAGELASQL